MHEWAPGAVVDARLAPGSPAFRATVRALLGGRAVGVFVPPGILEENGSATRDVVLCPSGEWRTVAGVAWPDDDAR